MSIPPQFLSSPNKFTLKERTILRLVPPAAALVLKGILRTCRVEVRGVEHWEELCRQSPKRIVAIWHESLGMAAGHYRRTGAYTLTSYSFDGELAARAIHCFGLHAVRGSSSRGGSEALTGLILALEQAGLAGFTLDGPRGPRREAKPGIAIFAARTQAPIIPHAFVVDRCRRLRSWDRFPIPKPFARIVSAFGPPIPPPADDSPEAVEATRRQVETELNRLHKTIEAELGARLE